MKCEKEGCHNKATKSLTVIDARGRVGGYSRTIKVCSLHNEQFRERKTSFGDRLKLFMKRVSQ